MFHLRSKLLIVLVSLVATGAVYARSGLYFNLNTGYTLSSLPNADKVSSTSSKKNEPLTFVVENGYEHDFNKFYGFGVELGGGFYGTTKYNSPTNNYEIKLYGIQFFAVNTFHLKPNLVLIAKGGLFRNFVNIRKNGGSIDGVLKSQIAINLGVGYYLSNHVALIGSYLHTFGDNVQKIEPLSGAPSINTLLIGLRYHF